MHLGPQETPTVTSALSLAASSLFVDEHRVGHPEDLANAAADGFSQF